MHVHDIDAFLERRLLPNYRVGPEVVQGYPPPEPARSPSTPSRCSVTGTFVSSRSTLLRDREPQARIRKDAKTRALYGPATGLPHRGSLTG